MKKKQIMWTNHVAAKKPEGGFLWVTYVNSAKRYAQFEKKKKAAPMPVREALDVANGLRTRGIEVIIVRAAPEVKYYND